MVDIVDVDIMDLTVEDIEQVVPSIRKTGTLLAGCYLLTKDHIMNQVITGIFLMKSDRSHLKTGLIDQVPRMVEHHLD